MHPVRRILLSRFGLAALLFLFLGGTLALCVRFLPPWASMTALIVITLGGACLLILAARRDMLSFRSAAHLLPDKECRAIAQMLPREQFEYLCQAFAAAQEAFRSISADRLLQRLIGDNAHTHVIENLSQQLDSILRGDTFGYQWSHFCLVYIRLENYDSYMLKNCNGHLLLDDFRRMYDTVAHAFSTVLNQRHLAHSTEWRNACVFLVNLCGSSPETTYDELDSMVTSLCIRCNDLIDQIADSFNVTLEAVVSAPYRDIIETHSIFDWMLMLKEYTDFVSGPRSVLGPHDLATMTAIGSVAPASQEKTYYSALLAEDFVRAEQALLELMQVSLSSDAYNVSALKSLVTICLRAAENIAASGSISPKHVASLNWEHDIQLCETREALNGLIHTFFEFLIGRSELRLREHSSTAKKIITLLDERCTDPDLSVIAISDALSLSQSYISRVFKREVGKSIPDYIHEKRIRIAKELLATTGLSINNIAQQVGYTTAWTLNRVFKRIVQMTPGAWRQIVQAGAGLEDTFV